MLIVIIPTYEAEANLPRLLSQLDGVRVIVSDGGSSDQTIAIAAHAGACLAMGAKGRGAQLRLGAHLALLSGQAEDWFLFLHADSHLPQNWQSVVTQAMAGSSPRYFRFRAKVPGLFGRFMDMMVGLRCAVLGLPYGDQGLLISRRLYEQVGGYAEIPLFEDVDMIERLRKLSRIRPLPAALVTDVSKYQRDGLFRRGLSNLRLLWRYKRGTDVVALLKAYQS